jgi:rubredoxin
MKTQRILEYDCFFCDVCRQYVYDESLGEPAKGIAAQTRVDNLPPSWHCPVCGATREQLRAATMFDDFVYEESFAERNAKVSGLACKAGHAAKVGR